MTPLSSNLAWKSAKEPKAALIASASSPVGSPPPSGLMFSQNSVWLAWPPAWLRSGVCLSAGSDDRLARSSSTGLSS